MQTIEDCRYEIFRDFFSGFLPREGNPADWSANHLANGLKRDKETWSTWKTECNQDVPSLWYLPQALNYKWNLKPRTSSCSLSADDMAAILRALLLFRTASKAAARHVKTKPRQLKVIPVIMPVG